MAVALLAVLAMLVLHMPATLATDPTQYFDWVVAYKSLSPLAGHPQQVIAINDEFPGPNLATVTNNVVSINVHNSLDEPFLLTWNGIQMRKNCWQDGTLGTNCPIPPGTNWTYVIQFKDQIGSFFYAPSTLFQKAAGGYGGIAIANRIVISVPFAPPTGEFTLLIGDWYSTDHKTLRHTLDNGKFLAHPDGVLINGKAPRQTIFKVQPGGTYRFRISNVGIATSLNFRIANHQMLVVEAEGTYLEQTLYNSLDLHVGQSCSVLVTMSEAPGSYYVVASPRFVEQIPDGIAFLQYDNYDSSAPTTAYPPGPAPMDYQFSIAQALSLRMNLTTGAARPNPQGAYRYSQIPLSKKVILANSAPIVNNKQRCAVDGNSFVYPDTPLQLADFLNITGSFNIFNLTSFHDLKPVGGPYVLSPLVLASGLKTNLTEFVFQNNEDTLQTWHLDGYSFYVVGMAHGNWTKKSRKLYNMKDAVSRSTTQVYPQSWTAALVQLDNKGMWNLRSQHLERQYLGQELYIRVWAPPAGPVLVDKNQKPIPSNEIYCGLALN